MELAEVKKIDKPKLYSSGEVAKFMGISYMALYRLVRDGKLKAFNIAKTDGKRPVFGFRAEDVQAYYDSLQNPNNPAQAKH
jgi:excisionase family DNA binding protein